jgi:fructose/tagatose bisphosphate aldolase
MTIIREREAALAIHHDHAAKGWCVPVFCAAGHWNVEAVLLAARRFGEKRGIGDPAVALAVTYRYRFMQQCERVTYSQDARTGFLSLMRHLEVLCAEPSCPYGNVRVLPHLDHADPARDAWALEEGLPFLASVMFDAQAYPREKNIAMTREYVARHGKDVLVEGIMEELVVSGRHGAHEEAASDQAYTERAVEYLRRTGADFLVADLGTEQQSEHAGGARYLDARARMLTEALGKPRLVLHGTSSLSPEEFSSLAGDGVLRVNMWTRIAREAGQYAAERLIADREAIAAGDFEATESRRYLMDSTEKAAEVMLETMELLMPDQ